VLPSKRFERSVCRETKITIVFLLQRFVVRCSIHGVYCRFYICPQIVCGILAVVMGSVACIEEKGSFANLGLGIPAGLSTVLAAGMYIVMVIILSSIYCLPKW